MEEKGNELDAFCFPGCEVWEICLGCVFDGVNWVCEGVLLGTAGLGGHESDQVVEGGSTSRSKDVS